MLESVLIEDEGLSKGRELAFVSRLHEGHVAEVKVFVFEVDTVKGSTDTLAGLRQFFDIWDYSNSLVDLRAKVEVAQKGS